MRLAFRSQDVTRREHSVYLDGVRFEFWDLLGALREIIHPGVAITSPETATHLVRAGVLRHPGTAAFPAKPGPKFGDLLHKLEEKERRLGCHAVPRAG